ncbi:sel1 repeat family protein, partial [Mesorhizobium sp. M8A.F.Ca.ET.023.01.1.1]
MRISELLKSTPELLRSSVLPALVAVAIFGAVGQAMAFDDKVFDDKT